MPAAIALFARAPVPGRVKTRLIGRFSAEHVCELYGAFVRDMWEMLEASQGDAQLFLYADEQHPEWRALAGQRLRLQRGDTLGERLVNCFDELHAAGYGPLLILGSDSPALPPRHLAHWRDLLEQHPAVVGPAEDGGYWAIGCRAPHPRMFEAVEWSTARTLELTEAALARCAMPPARLAEHYDVDAPEDLARLSEETNLPRHTRVWVETHSRKRRA